MKREEIETDLQGYQKRAERVFEALKEFQKIKTRIYKGAPGVVEGEEWASKMPKVEYAIQCAYAESKFHPLDRLLSDKKHDLVLAYARICKLIDAFSEGVEHLNKEAK